MKQTVHVAARSLFQKSVATCACHVLFSTYMCFQQIVLQFFTEGFGDSEVVYLL